MPVRGNGRFIPRFYKMRGFQGLLMELYKDRKFAEALMDKILETQIQRFNAYLETIDPYIDVVIRKGLLWIEP